ncbi:TetR family transcriptional regulator [Nonomuraea soli]|uniref:AcrR family transcriptional regulator n=1 Tax=Nonomuraea soli TaxID=1032476 RepID=A0A7W0CN24_9ACTN|nr:TetR family transcriptional regulator [Nonomuraea soli]MBA2894120.1 AcrR family transcriptional regulator [Nonomuraea soli]
MSRAEATKSRILQAATAEFAAYGFAGARVDRIAKAASVNKNLIYVYFTSKDTLFETVFDAEVARGLDAVPFTVDDLPGYARRVHEHCRRHPSVIRLVAWHRLERADRPDLTAASPSHAAKLSAIETAQREGRLSDTFSPDILLALIVALATSDGPVAAAPLPHRPGHTEEISEAIAEAVRKLTTGHP